MSNTSCYSRPGSGRRKDSTRISRCFVGRQFAWRILLSTWLFCFFTVVLAQGSTPTSSGLALTSTAASPTPTSAGGKKNCYVSAGIEHCDDPEASPGAEPDCSFQPPEYNKGLRIGGLFIILATSAIAVFGPVFLERFTRLELTSLVFTIIKQFGTGVIISTAFVHLLTESGVIFDNKCIGELAYESTNTAIAMAGIIIAFIAEYIGDRFIQARANKLAAARGEAATVGSGNEKEPQDGSENSHGHLHVHSDSYPHGHHAEDQLSVLILEAGIIFHSILIGVTVAVAENSTFTTLFVVIVFHQAFEGLALGSRIAALPAKTTGMLSKLIMCSAFALVTPVGMAIGLGVINTFNENSKSTLIALGTLDALSAGILVWVGVVEMLAGDWVFFGGEMKTAGVVKTLVGGLSLAGGMILMSLLGKWT